jgi:hypothetical protein
MRDFSPLYVRYGSLTTEEVEAARRCMSAFARKRTNGPTSWDVRLVPICIIVLTHDHRCIDGVTLLLADCICRRPRSPRSSQWRNRS